MTWREEVFVLIKKNIASDPLIGWNEYDTSLDEVNILKLIMKHLNYRSPDEQ